MLASRSSPATALDVTRHYEDLAWAYAKLWGRRLHHGIWKSRSDTIEAATERLLEVVTTPLEICAGDFVVDIGCGNGEDARWIVRQFGAEVSGITLTGAPPAHDDHLNFERGDWLENSYPDNRFDRAIAIESLDHMPDKLAFFQELARTLRPGGRAALTCWTTASDLGFLDALLIKRLCRDGALPSLESLPELRGFAEQTNLRLTKHRDLTREVEPTWGRIGGRMLRSSIDLRFLGRALRVGILRPAFAFTIPAMILAYRTGALRYHALWLEKPTSAVDEITESEQDSHWRSAHPGPKWTNS